MYREVYRVKVRKDGSIYLPASVREKLGVREGDELSLIVVDKYVILKPVKTVFRLGVESRKVSRISIEDSEKQSEEMQEKLYG